MTYAKGTEVSIAASEQQIKAMLQKAGADAIVIAETVGRAQVAFQLRQRQIRFNIILPAREDFARSPARNLARSHSAMTEAWMQACRERWRALHLCIKAKLESIEQNIETFDEAFLAHVVMPNGETVGEAVIPEVQGRLAGRPPRPLLPPANS